MGGPKDRCLCRFGDCDRLYGKAQARSNNEQFSYTLQYIAVRLALKTYQIASFLDSIYISYLSALTIHQLVPWRNWLARLTVMRCSKSGG